MDWKINRLQVCLIRYFFFGPVWELEIMKKSRINNIFLNKIIYYEKNYEKLRESNLIVLWSLNLFFFKQSFFSHREYWRRCNFWNNNINMWEWNFAIIFFFKYLRMNCVFSFDFTYSNHKYKLNHFHKTLSTV